VISAVIGSGIFLTASQIAAEVRFPIWFLLVWVAGGAFSWMAATAFAELGAMFPRAGGQYVYLREAFGEFVAFLYGWMIFAVAVTGTIGAVAVAFAEYTGAFLPQLAASHPIASIAGWTFTRSHAVALTAIVAVTVVNILGVKRGAALQNVATWMKFLAMVAFIVLGFAIGKGSWSNYSTSVTAPAGRSLLSALGVALVAVFWAYDGWVYITWVAGEVQEPRRNLPRALIYGLIACGAVYVSINAAYLYALPMERIAHEVTVAQASAARLFSPAAARWLSALIAVSCFGAMCSAILTGARVYYAMANDGVFFHRMAHVDRRWRTPAFSLAVQGVWSAVLALSGRFEQLYTYVMFMMVITYALTVVGLFILRRTRPEAPRPYRCAGYPWLPALYVLIAFAFALNMLLTRSRESLAGTVVVAVGVPGYVYWRRAKSQRGPVITAVREQAGNNDPIEK
jgi:APA family basic amino acid/polyamine antiporter